MDETRIRLAKRVCLFAHYHQDAIIADHVVYYLNAIKNSGFEIVFISTCDLKETEVKIIENICSFIIIRENSGLDFGSWIDAYQKLMPLSADFLLLTNDSVYGPITDLSNYIDELISVPADFYGAVDCLIVRPHLQSWFVLLRKSAFESPVFEKFLTSPIPDDLSKWEIIQNYEIGLTQSLLKQGLSYHPGYSPSKRGLLAERWPYNPAHLLWRPLIEKCGVPFLKIDLIRRNPVFVKNVDDWRAVIEPRNAKLAQMIERDIQTRGRTASLGSFGRFRASLESKVPGEWPELLGFFVRDHDWPPQRRFSRLVNYIIFKFARSFAQTMRDFIKQSNQKRSTRATQGRP